MDEKKKEQLNNLRHSTAHLLAAAVMALYPDAKRAIGPAIENGFYFDFDFGTTKISEEDFPQIEAKMREILPSWQSFERHELTADEAKKEYPNNPYKHELIEEFTKDGQKVSFYKSGDYWDLCKGGHSPHPKNDLKHFKLLSVAGAYWRGSEKNPMLTRIYGTVFPSKTGLDEYLTMMEEAKKRDHKKLGKELDLFFFAETSPGMVYWLPNGLVLYNTIYDFVRKMYAKYDYKEVATPQLNKKELYITSGHYDHYWPDMFVADMGKDEVFGIKPMNCPNAMTIFNMRTRSYNELPLRFAETTMLHRFELSGTLNGLFRTRQFRQDDAHIFISEKHIESEFENLIKMVEEIYGAFGISYRLRFGTRPEKFLGEAKDWDFAEETLRKVLEQSGKEFFEVGGEGAFYGPKVDILMKDTLGREWQTGTIQLDLQQPKRFGLKYTDSDGIEKTPIVFHRAIYGSFERFLGVLVEHFAGKFPVWLSPVQVMLLPIADRHVEASQRLYNALQDAGIRVELNDTANTLQAKIRTATLQKIPFMGIIGDKEVQDGDLLSVRTREGVDLGSLEISQFIQQVKNHIDKKE